MVIAFDKRNDVEDTIMFEMSDHYVVQSRRNLAPTKEEIILFSEENAEDKAEKVFDRWSQ